MEIQAPAPPVDVRNDYGVPNLLLFYYLPLCPENKEYLLAALKDSRSWNAWECYQAEEQLRQQLGKGSLPSDDSVKSRQERAAYRAKVIAYLRENSEGGWLLMDQTTDSEYQKTVKKAEASAWIRRTLRSHYATDTKPSQVGVIFNTISNFIASSVSGEHKYYLNDVVFKFDTNTNIFQPTIQVSSFTVKQEPAKGVKDCIHVSIRTLDSTYRLDRSAWADASDKAKDLIAAGEKIRKEMALDFLGQEG